MFPLSPRALNYFLIVVGGTCLVAGMFFVYMLLSKLGIIWTPFTCLTDEVGQLSTSAGYFEASQTTCSAIAKGPTVISLVASKTKRGKKTLIFKYVRAYDDSPSAEPAIETVDNDTVRITVTFVGRIICRREHWENVAIQYRIGQEFEAAVSPLPSCPEA